MFTLGRITATAPSGQHINIETPIALAPMAGVSDRPFRNLCRAQGAGVVFHEMVSSKPELRHTTKSEQRRVSHQDPQPRAVQLLGNEPQMLATAARQAVADGAELIDINMGCPAKKVCRRAAGSALMGQPALVRQLLTATVKAVDIPVSLKIRTGMDENQINAPEIARIAEDAGISLLSIHGRHRAQRYEGQAEYDTIAQVVDAVEIPVLANGDIDSPKKARQVLNDTHAAGIMVGRAALGRPWLFAELKAALNGLPAPPTPEPDEILALLQKQLADIHQHYGEQTGVRIARKHWKWYSTHLNINDAAGFNRLQTASDQHQWLLDCAVNQIKNPAG